MSLASPDGRIGRLRVIRVIGAGGFATVLEAHDDRLEDRVSVKVLAENHSLDPDVRARFLAEGRLLRRIDSPHVVRVLDLGETDRQQPYLVLELADRGDLAARVAHLREQGWRPSAVDLLAVLRPLADALEAVHRADVVHRDVSPGNVLLTSTLAPTDDAGRSPLVAADERVLLADLGLSKDLARSSGLTVAGGTDGFRPPEQRSGPGTVDPRADLWSLSVMAVWLIGGVTPRDAGHARELLAVAAVPEAFRAAVLRSMAEDPADRHEDVTSWFDEVGAALELSEPGAGTAAGGEQGVAPVAGTDPAAASTPRNRWRVLAVVLAVGVLLGLGGAQLVGGGGPRVEQIDGETHVTATDGDLEVTLVGPQSVPSGQTASFRIRASGADAWAWIAPDGAIHPDAPEVRIATSGTGFATIRLVATSADGEHASIEHRLRVRER